ncbi:hypothetical protein FKG94_27045 [Exilibacterium tricleocarpae]|uniref:Uncharacterized protein n=1 Tax=Exilibacterium tricleocarpae TaxID=2591008 RepID=A0A545SNC8_9GAMM|nr:hypothetical protein [Exilibacterium tricleocarpae]TQV66492.1 hypothetical protein FKG94_27045 [Exilibacterium tricleocarpae]
MSKRKVVGVLGRAAVVALIVGQGSAWAMQQRGADGRPQINLFPTSVVESLSEASQAAKDMETDMYEVVAELEKQKEVYDRTQCQGSTDKGCTQLRRNIRQAYKDMLDVMKERIPTMRATLNNTSDMMGTRIRSELGRKMTPGDVQRTLAGRATKSGLPSVSSRPSARQGKLSKMFSRYYDLVRRGDKQGQALPVLASQIYIDSMESLDYLDLIEAEIGSQSTELVLELEWGELTDQLTTTVGEVKTLLWGEGETAEDILDVGLAEETVEESYSDLLVD